MVNSLPGARADCGRSLDFVIAIKCQILILQPARYKSFAIASYVAGLVTRTWDKRAFKRLPRVAAKKCELKKHKIYFFTHGTFESKQKTIFHKS